MNLKERNYAGNHMVVGSLKVLGNIDGGGVKEIRRDVDLIQKQAEQIAKTQNQYWRDLSDDGIISPVEKQMLLKEWRNIQYSQSAIYTQARSLGYDDSNPIIQTYLAAYNALYEYLYVTLKLFDNMEEDTPIESRDTFNDMFNTYYYAESFVLIALSKGILDTVNIRSLQSLNEPGEEGEIGLYKSGMYQYVDGAWTAVATGNYKGARNSLPPTVENDFFLVSEDFSILDGLYINGEQLYVNGEELAIKRLFKKGYIYYCKDGLWYRESDKSNYRYVAAFADVLNITGELPQIFQDALDDLEESLTGAIDDVSNTVNNLDLHKPVYLGASSALPQNPGNGDYFCYSGSTTGDFWRRSDVYRWTNGAWEHLLPTDSRYGSYYMAALEDILALNETSAGYFTAIFTQSFFSNNAVIETLSTRTLVLKTNGAIQSEVYTQNTQGFRIGSDGSVDFSGTVHIGGNTTIDGESTVMRNVTITGNSTFSGMLQGATGTGTFRGNIEAVDGFFQANGTPFQPMVMVNFGYKEGVFHNISSKNVSYIYREAEGIYTIRLDRAVWLDMHYYGGSNYIDVFTIANGAVDFDDGFNKPVLVQPNWLREAVDYRLSTYNGRAYVDYITIYIIDNESNELVDPRALQCFIFGSETN